GTQGSDDQGEDHLSAERQPAHASPDAQAQPGASRLVRLHSPRRLQRHLRIPGPLYLGPKSCNGARRKHRRITLKGVRERYCHGGWWPTTPDIGLFNPAKMRTTRYRYRGTAIPTPWPTMG